MWKGSNGHTGDLFSLTSRHNSHIDVLRTWIVESWPEDIEVNMITPDETQSAPVERRRRICLEWGAGNSPLSRRSLLRVKRGKIMGTHFSIIKLYEEPCSSCSISLHALHHVHYYIILSMAVAARLPRVLYCYPWAAMDSSCTLMAGMVFDKVDKYS